MTVIPICGNRNRSMQKDTMYAVWVAPLLLIIAICPTWAQSGAQEPEVMYAQEGKSVQFPTKHAIEDGVYMTWYWTETEPNDKPQEVFSKHGLGGTDIKPPWKNRVSVPDPDYSLTINKVIGSDFGYFKYELKDKQSKFTKMYRLRKVTLDPSSVFLLGERLSLTCQVEPSAVRTTITWSAPETVDRTSWTEASRSTKSTLTLVNVSGRHKGVWTCSVQYKEHKTEATTTIHVIDLSPSPKEPIYTSVHATSQLQLPCSISSPVGWEMVLSKGLQGGSWSFLPDPGLEQGPKDPRLLASLSTNSTPHWNITAGSGMDGSALQKGPQGNNLSLSKKAVTTQDRGTYTCALSFKTVNLERVIKVEVLQVFARPSTSAFEGQSLNLTCTLGHSLAPELEVKWIPPKTAPLPTMGSSPQAHTLFIAKVSVGQNGRWRCELRKNGTVLTYADVLLKIERVPVDVWLWVGIASTGLIVILLIFIGRSLMRRYRQRRRTQRRKTRFCCCKDPNPQKGFYRT